MFKRAQNIGRPELQEQISFRSKINRNKNAKLSLAQQIDMSYDNQISGLDKRANLQSNIIKAMLSSGQTIEQQMKYKRHILSQFTPKFSTSPSKNLKINPNKRHRPQLISFSDKHKINSSMNDRILERSRYNSFLQIMSFASPSKDGKSWMKQEQQNYIRCQSQRGYRCKLIGRKINSRSSARSKQLISKSSSQYPTHRENIDIRPWISHGLERQFQQF